MKKTIDTSTKNIIDLIKAIDLGELKLPDLTTVIDSSSVISEENSSPSFDNNSSSSDIVEEKNYYVKHKEVNTEKIYIITETDKIEIVPRENYKKGENITYYVYRLGNIEHTSVQNFDLTKSIIGVFIFIIQENYGQKQHII